MKFFAAPYTFLPLRERFFYFWCILSRQRHSERFRHSDRLLLKIKQVLAFFSHSSCSAQRIEGQFLFAGHKLSVQLRVPSSDAEVFYQVFIEEEYARSIELIRERIQLSDKPLLIDAGANIGLSALYFSTQLPACRLLLLEPFAGNVQAIHTHIRQNGLSARVLNAALWPRQAMLKVNTGFRDGKEWSITVQESGTGHIQGITPAILAGNEGEVIDILKVDIEGSEFSVFGTGETARILKNIKAVIMEIHDDAGNRHQLTDTFIRNGFEYMELGELTLFLNRLYLRI